MLWEFPNLDFEPTINPIDGLDEPEAVNLDANQLPGEETLPPDFGDFGDFNQPNGEGEPNDLEVSPTETDIPKPTPSLDFDEKELFIDPNTIAPPSSSFDDEFGKNFTPEPQDDVELLEADNTEILEEEDPFADFGDFFQDDLASVPPKSSKGNGLKIGIGAGIIVAIGAFGAAYTGVLPMGATQSPDTVTFNNSVTAQPEPEEEVKTPKAQDDDVNAENMETEPGDGDEGTATGDDAEPVDAAESESKPESEQEPEPKAEPKPESKPEPKPEPKPKPQPKPKVAKVKDNAALVDEGWNNVDRGRLKSAITSFAKVLDKNATHAEANYGLGYALIQQGRQQEAKRFLCTSLSKVKNDSSPAGVSTLRDVKGLLKNNQLSCD